MKYLDSNIFIFAFISDDKNSELCKSVLEKVSSGSLTACTSVLAWDEITWIARKSLGRQDSLDEGKKFLEFPFMDILDADESTVRLAQNLIEKYDINPRDAIHAATAINAGAKEIITDDSDFDRIKELKRLTIEQAAK